MSTSTTLPPTASTVEPVRKSITVRATPEHAFRVFTEEMDSWWPRTHHIGSSPMKRVVVTPQAGGAIFTEQEDGTTCPWASVKLWEPPHRFIMFWQVSPEWQYEPDLTHCSEVELTFTPLPNGDTRVDLEHRHIERHAGPFAAMREQVNAEGGWGSLLELFATKAGEAA